MRYVADSDGVRLDVFLSGACGITRSNAKTVIERQGAIVNGALKYKSATELKVGDIVEFELPEPVAPLIEAADIRLDIVYEDSDIAVINKPQGMVVHPASSYHANDTLVNALLHNIKELSGINGVARPGIVHRLDKDTSGLIVIAKNDNAHNSLQKQIQEKSARRIYLGLTDGNFKEDCGRIDAALARSKKDRKKIAVDESGRCAVTDYAVLERFGAYTLVRYVLQTGRTHQIRVHSAYVHHPIVGDAVYGGSQKLYSKGQLLHAKQLVLTHPTSGERMTFECDLPDYFENILTKLRKTTKN